MTSLSACFDYRPNDEPEQAARVSRDSAVALVPIPASVERLVSGAPRAWDGGASDAQLVEALMRGEPSAFPKIWKRYTRLVRHILRLELGTDSACEDLQQEVFLAFLRSVKNLQDGAALRSYLATVTVRFARLELRRRKVRRSVALSDTGTLPAHPVLPGDVEGRDALRLLSRTLDQLSRRRRLAFLLRHVEGLSLVETALTLGISESTAKRELSRARSDLVRRLSSEPAFTAHCKSLLATPEVRIGAGAKIAAGILAAARRRYGLDNLDSGHSKTFSVFTDSPAS